MTPPATPLMSASIVLNTFEQLESGGHLEQVRRLLLPGCRDRLANLTAGDWVNLDDHLSVYEATLSALGPGRSFDVWHGTMLITLQKGLYRKLWSGLNRVNAESPINFYRHVGASWSMATRLCGEQSWEGEEGRGTVKWHQLPRAMIESAGFCMSMRAKLEAVLAASRVEGTVKQIRRDLDAGALQLLATWR